MHLAAAERPFVHEEPEPQVVQGERGDVRAQALARAQPREDLAAHARALAVVVGEADPALAEVGLRERLGDVVQQRAPAQRVAAREVVGERLGEHRGDPRAEGVVVEHGGRVALERDRVLEHLERVVVGVLVVVDRLLDPAQRPELGQDRGAGAGLLEQRHAVERAVRRECAPQLREDPLPGDAVQPGRVLAGGGERRGLGLQVQLDREPRHAQHPQRVGGERLGADHPQAARGEARQAAGGVHRLAARERLGDRVHRQVARAQVVLEGRALERGAVHLPRAAGPDDAPGAERVREREGRGAARGGGPDGLCGALGVGDDHVEVEHRAGAPEQPVADRAADEVGVLAGQRGAGQRERVDAGHGAPWCSRGTRAPIPHVTS